MVEKSTTVYVSVNASPPWARVLGQPQSHEWPRCDTLSFNFFQDRPLAREEEWLDAVQKRRVAMVQDTTSREAAQHAFIKSVHGVRYQVKDVARSVVFYTQHLAISAKRSAASRSLFSPTNVSTSAVTKTTPSAAATSARRRWPYRTFTTIKTGSDIRSAALPMVGSASDGTKLLTK